jgi:hypothetical protein
MEASMARTIKILRGEEQLGPYTPEEIQEYLASGALQHSDMAWSNGMTGWTTVAEVLNAIPNNLDSQESDVDVQANSHISPREFRLLLEESANEIRLILNG